MAGRYLIHEFDDTDNPNTISDDDFLDLTAGVIQGQRYMFRITIRRYDGTEYDQEHDLWWSRAYNPALTGPFAGMSVAARNRAKAALMSDLFRAGSIWDGDILNEILDDDEVDESDRDIIEAIADGDWFVSNFRCFSYLAGGGGDVKNPIVGTLRAPKTSRTFRKGRAGAYCPFLNDSNVDLRDIQIYKSDEEHDPTHCIRFSFEKYYVDNQEQLNKVRPTFIHQLEAALSKHLADEGIAASYKILKPIAYALQINISLTLYTYNTRAGTPNLRTYKYPKISSTSWPTIQLGCYFDHYFYNTIPSPAIAAKSIRLLHKDSKSYTHNDKTAEVNGKALSYVQILFRLRSMSMLTKYHIDASIFSAPRQVNKADLNNEDNLRRRFDAIDCTCKTMSRPHKTKEKKHRPMLKCVWVGDCESYVGLTGRDPMHPYYKIGESEEEYLTRLATEPEILSRKHTLYLIGVCPIDATDPRHVSIFNTWVQCRTHFENFYADEAARLYDTLTQAQKDRRDDSDFAIPIIEVTLFFHNLRYDKAVIQNETHLSSILKKGNTIYDMSLFIDLPDIKNAIKLQFFDSIKHLQSPLRDLPTAYALPRHLSKKEGGIYYQYFSPEKRHIPCTVKEYIAFRPFDKSLDSYILSEEQAIEEVSTLLREVGAWIDDAPVSLDTIFDPDELYEYYLIFDCLVLAAALLVYRSNIEDVCSDYIQIDPINPLEYRTSSSLSMAIMESVGCFEGVHEYSGLLKEYIMRSVRGGRCNPHPDFENKLAQPEGGISDCDAVSLYPTAIKALQFVPTCGPAKINPVVHDFMWLCANSDSAIVTVRITGIHNKKTFAQPIIAWKNPKNEIEYIQDLPDGNPFIITVHFLELVEYLTYHHITFDILYGLYWPKDPNSGAADHIGRRWSQLQQKLFDARANAKAELKSTGNKKFEVQQGLLKLILNSMYGKTIMKAAHSKTVILPFSEADDKERAWRYVYDRWGELTKAPDYTNMDMVLTLNKADDSFTFPLHGTSCLAMSRKIMNAVFEACELAQAHVYYTDTDSMFIPKNKMGLIADHYETTKETTMPTLYGNNLGQFHADLSGKDFVRYIGGHLDQAERYFPKGATDENIVADFMYPTRKKLYLLATSVEVKDPVTGLSTIARSVVTKGKGITKVGLIAYAAENYADLDDPTLWPEYKDPVQRSLLSIYKTMSDTNATHKVCLNPRGRTMFTYKGGGVFTSTVPYYRKISPRVADISEPKHDVEELVRKGAEIESKVLPYLSQPIYEQRSAPVSRKRKTPVLQDNSLELLAAAALEDLRPNKKPYAYD